MIPYLCYFFFSCATNIVSFFEKKKFYDDFLYLCNKFFKKRDELWTKNSLLHPKRREQTLTILERLRTAVGNTFNAQDEKLIREDIHHAFINHQISRDVFGLNPILYALQTAEITVNEIGLRRDG